MVRTFQHPASAPVLMLQMLQETAVKPICVKVPYSIEPAAVARHGVGCVKAQTGEDMRVDFRAFLRRDCPERVHFTKAGGEKRKHPPPRVDAPPPVVTLAS